VTFLVHALAFVLIAGLVAAAGLAVAFFITRSYRAGTGASSGATS